MKPQYKFLLSIFAIATIGAAIGPIVNRLRDLSDVRLSISPTSGHALVWNGTQWTNGAVSGGNVTNTYNTLISTNSYTSNFYTTNINAQTINSTTNIFNVAKGGHLEISSNLTVLKVGPSKMVQTDSSTNLAAVTIGTGLAFDGTTLSSSGGSAVYVTGTSVSAPNFANTASVTWSISGTNVTAITTNSYDTLNATTLNVGTLNLTNQMSPSAVSLNTYAGYAAGTAYSVTTTYTNLAFGTTTTATTIAVAGTYLLTANVGVKYNGLTYVAAQTATFKIRRTNNTAADVANAIRTVEMPVLTTFTGGDVFPLPPVIYVAAAGDIIEIYGSVSATPGAGTVNADSAEIFALRIQ